VAYDPADPLGNQVFYVLLAGQLPPGIQCNSAGVISGIPQAVANIQGVPLPVNSDTTSVFAIRAYTKKQY
jgi:type III secretory pathway component EscS